jgi:hypothetical protein
LGREAGVKKDKGKRIKNKNGKDVDVGRRLDVFVISPGLRRFNVQGVQKFSKITLMGDFHISRILETSK